MLSVDVCGDGPDLVLLHGWGMHSGVMMPWAQELAEWFRVTTVDLPGHGNSGCASLSQLEDWADAVLDAVPSGGWWLGWSLGGLIAMTAAQRKPENILGVLLVASTPKFVADTDWQAAVDVRVFEQFANQLQENIERTLLRFMSLQVRGSEGSGEVLRRLRAELNARPHANAQALRSGLEFLKTSDMREVLESMVLPVFWLLGERDTLVPQQVGAATPRDRTAVVAGAGHAPFLSHPRQCAEQVRRWLLERQECGEYAAN